MPVDVSMYNNTPKPPNPLELLSQSVGLANAGQQNRLLQGQTQLQQQDIDFRKGLSDAEAASIDPLGRQDTNKFNQIIAKDPRTAWKAQELLQQGVQLNAPTQYMGQDENGNPQQRYVPAQDMRNLMVTPQQVSDIHDHFNDMNDALTTLIQKPDLSLKDVISATGDLVASGRVKTQEAAAEYATMPQGENGAPPSSDQLRQWLNNYHQQMHTNMQPFLAIHPPPRSSPGIAAAMPAGQEQRTADAVKRTTVTRESAAAATSAVPILQKIHDLSAEGAKTGPTQEWKNNLRSVLASNGFPSEGDDASLFQELQKYMAQGVQAFGGVGSDKQLDAIQHANPNDKMLPKAIQDVTSFMIAQAKAAKAKSAAMQKAVGKSNDPAKQEQFELDWNQNYDPRIIQFHTMSADEKKQFVDKLSSTDAQVFFDKRKALKSMGALDAVK